MNDRIYLFGVGLYLLISLYIESPMMVYALVGIMTLEGVTGYTLPKIMQKITQKRVETGLLEPSKPSRFNFEACRAARLTLAAVIFLSYVAVYNYHIEVLWFFPWFMGFAILGAGASGVCPIYLAIRWLGFK